MIVRFRPCRGTHDIDGQLETNVFQVLLTSSDPLSLSELYCQREKIQAKSLDPETPVPELENIMFALAKLLAEGDIEPVFHY